MGFKKDNAVLPKSYNVLAITIIPKTAKNGAICALLSTLRIILPLFLPE